MYFFRSSITYNSYFSRDQSKCKFVKLLSTRIKIHQILVTFKTTNQFYFKFCINLHCQETQLICTFIAEILYAFNKRNLSGYKFGSIESLKFGTLMDSFRQNNIKFQLKKDRRSYLSWHWRVMRSLKKNWLVVSNMWILWIFTQQLKSPKISL